MKLARNMRQFDSACCFVKVIIAKHFGTIDGCANSLGPGVAKYEDGSSEKFWRVSC
jgi:hypothetical protein